MKNIDTLIIGSGPAALSAALTLNNRNKTVQIFGPANSSDKVTKAKEINNYLGFPHASGKQLSQAFVNHINEYGLTITDDRITKIYKLGNSFAATSGSGKTITASSIIIASGMVIDKSLKGENEFLGRGVSYCATCDGGLYRKKNVIAISYSKHYENEVNFLSELAGLLTYIPMYKDYTKIDKKNVNIINETPLEITSDSSTSELILTTDSFHLKCDGIFILKDSIAPDKLIDGLSTDGPHIKVDRQMNTNIPGVFACGDVTGRPYQYMKAAGEGNVAALSAVDFLNLAK